MNAPSAPPPAITRSPVSGPEQAMENIGRTAQAINSRSISQPEQVTSNSIQTVGGASQTDPVSNDDSPTHTPDWPLPATRWVPRPRLTKATSEPSHRVCRVNEDGEWETLYPWEGDQALEPHLCLPPDWPLSTERPQLGRDEIQAPIVFELKMPALKYHAHLECITRPCLPKREYERRVFAGE